MYELKRLPEDFFVEEVPDIEIKKSGEYIYLLLEKRNHNSEDCIAHLCQRFRLQRRNIGYAGNKDKNAVTRQYVSVKGMVPEYKTSDFSFTPVGLGDRHISTGILKGNRFRIVVRNIDKKPQKIAQMINYFDEQRFGKNNLEIGLALVKKDFRAACSLIDIREVRESLHEKPTDFVNALRFVAMKILNLYIHSVQSYIFNEVAAGLASGHECFTSQYEKGIFQFPKEKVENQVLPLVSFDSELKGVPGKKTEEALKRIGISQRDFIIRQLSGVTPMGGERDLTADVNDLKIGKLEEDEIYPGMKKCTVNFELGKGSYATVAVRMMMVSGEK